MNFEMKSFVIEAKNLLVNLLCLYIVHCRLYNLQAMNSIKFCEIILALVNGKW